MLISFISAKKSKTPSKKVWLDSSITYQVFYYYTGHGWSPSINISNPFALMSSMVFDFQISKNVYLSQNI